MKNSILVDKDFFEDSIWMSYRYCIGRKTIAAVSRAADIARYAKYLSENRRKFNAKDIRQEISDCLGFSNNIYIEGNEYNYDAYSIIFSYIANNEINFTKQKLYINVNDGSVEVVNIENPGPTSRPYDPKSDAHDIIPWIELANYMAGDIVEVTIEYNGETQIIDCIKTFCPYTFEVRWKSIKNFEKGFNNFYLAPEYIKEIKLKSI